MTEAMCVIGDAVQTLERRFFFKLLHTESCLMLNAHLPTGSRQLAISPTADWESAFVGRCVPNADSIVGANRRYSADSKFESALEPVGASR